MRDKHDIALDTQRCEQGVGIPPVLHEGLGTGAASGQFFGVAHTD